MDGKTHWQKQKTHIDKGVDFIEKVNKKQLIELKEEMQKEIPNKPLRKVSSRTSFIEKSRELYRLRRKSQHDGNLL